MRAAGFGDAEVAEIVSQVVLNTLTNSLNRVVNKGIDFPRVAALKNEVRK